MEQSFQGKKAPFDIDALLHPSKAFRHPLDVVRDTDMTVAEKRSVLASWASDASAIESNPALRETASGSVVNYDEIIDALQSLDGEQSSETVTYTFKRRQRRRRWAKWKDRGGRSDNGVGSSAFVRNSQAPVCPHSLSVAVVCHLAVCRDRKGAELT